MNVGYLISGGAAILVLLGFLVKLIVDRKEATIQTLKERNDWLEQQLKAAKENAPDIVADRLSKRIVLLEKEIEVLSKDHEKNQVVIVAKEKELGGAKTAMRELEDQIERAQETMRQAEDKIYELAYYKEQFGCPHCGAELTTLAGDQEEYREYSCGHVMSFERDLPCPYDPDFPTLHDYKLETDLLGNGTWICKPKGINKNGYKLSLGTQFGETEEEAKQKVISVLEKHSARRKLKSQVT